MADPFDEQMRDYTFGGIDGITVSLALLSGLVASKKVRNVIILGGLLSTLSGAMSMGLGDYLAIDSVKDRKDTASVSGLRVFAGYAFASSIPLLAYLFFADIKYAFKVSVTMSFIALIIFGYIRGHLFGDDILSSVAKTVSIGLITFGLTYQVSNNIPI